MVRAAVPIRPERPRRAHRRHAGCRPWRPALLAGGVLLAGCAQEAPRTGAPGEDARRALAEHRSAGPILAVVRGNPFGMDEARLNTLVTQAMAEGVRALTVDFTTYPDRAAAPEPHLVVILDPVGEPPAAAACGAPETVATAPASERLSVLAVFCQGDKALDMVREEDRVAGPTDRAFERLLWRTSQSPVSRRLREHLRLRPSAPLAQPRGRRQLRSLMGAAAPRRGAPAHHPEREQSVAVLIIGGLASYDRALRRRSRIAARLAVASGRSNPSASRPPCQAQSVSISNNARSAAAKSIS